MGILDEIARGGGINALDVVKSGAQGRRDAMTLKESESNLADAALRRKVKKAEFDEWSSAPQKESRTSTAKKQTMMANEYMEPNAQRERDLKIQASIGSSKQAMYINKANTFLNITRNLGTNATAEDYALAYNRIPADERKALGLTNEFTPENMSKIKYRQREAIDTVQHIQAMELQGMKAKSAAAGKSLLKRPQLPQYQNNPEDVSMEMMALQGNVEFTDAKAFPIFGSEAQLKQTSLMVQDLYNSMLAEDYEQADKKYQQGQSYIRRSPSDIKQEARTKVRAYLADQDTGALLSPEDASNQVIRWKSEKAKLMERLDAKWSSRSVKEQDMLLEKAYQKFSIENYLGIRDAELKEKVYAP